MSARLLADLIPHIVFTLNVAIFLSACTWFLSRRYFPAAGRQRNAFVLLCLFTVGVRAAYIALFAYTFPDRMVSPDGARYLYEIQRIAWRPWEWNPITGHGPHYQVTAKMGMSYLYGIVLFIHQIDSLYAVLVLNIVWGLLTGVVVFLLTRRLTSSPVPAFLAMALVAVYPETLFWTARVARENMTLFLVPALIYAGLRLYETFRLRYAWYALLLIVVLLLTRAQLVLFTGLIAVYFGVLSLRARRRSSALLLTACTGTALYAAFAVIKAQIKRAVGTEIFHYLTFDAAFWLSQFGSFTEHIGSVLSPVARGSYGALGIIIFPIVSLAFLLFLLALVRFRRVFSGHTTAAGLIVFVTLSFLAMLAFFGSVNIRYRATVAPFIVSIICVSGYYYWRRMRLPIVRLSSVHAQRQSLGSTVVGDW